MLPYLLSKKAENITRGDHGSIQRILPADDDKLPEFKEEPL